MNKYYKEESINKILDFEIQNASRIFRFLVTDDNDDSFVPKLKSDYILCDCSNDEDFTIGLNWKKYFDDNGNKPVVFINTSSMFKQFELKGPQYNRYGSGAALWAQYFYECFRDKMWREKRTKFIFVVKEEDMTSMCQFVDAGFIVELKTYYIQRQKSTIQDINLQEQSGPVLTKKLTSPKNNVNK